MAGITLEIAKAKLNIWLEAEEAVALGQEYQIGQERLKRANLADIRKSIDYWSGKVKALEAGGRNRVYGVIPRD